MILGWRETTLGAEIDLVYGKGLKEGDRLPGSIPVFGSNGRVGWHEQALVEGPGIVVGRKGSAGALAFSEGPFWPIDTTYYVQNKGGHDWRFLRYLLQHLRLELLNSDTAVPGLKRETALSLTVTMPPREEQVRIGNLLLTTERASDIENRTLAATRELKQAAMNEVFTRGLRGEQQKETEVGPIPASWSVRPLSELREFLQYGTSVKCDYHRAGNPVLRIPNILNGLVDVDDLKWAEVEPSQQKALALGIGDVLFIRTNGVRERVGSTAVYGGRPEGALFASYLIRARLHTDLLLPGFLHAFTQTEAGRSQLAGSASPAADGKFNINTKAIDSMLVPITDINEQSEVVDVLRAIDTSALLHQRKSAALYELFSTLLDDLMTGRLRMRDSSDVVAV